MLNVENAFEDNQIILLRPSIKNYSPHPRRDKRNGGRLKAEGCMEQSSSFRLSF